jgi:hypothetical protein
MNWHEHSRNRAKEWCETGVRQAAGRERQGNEKAAGETPFFFGSMRLTTRFARRTLTLIAAGCSG